MLTSVECLIVAAKCEGLTPVEKCVYVVIAEHCNDKRECFPSIDRLCTRVGCSQTTLSRALNRLESKGYLSRISSNGRSNLYRFLNPEGILGDRKRRKGVALVDNGHLDDKLSKLSTRDRPIREDLSDTSWAV